jgi:hypothetical protein
MVTPGIEEALIDSSTYEVFLVIGLLLLRKGISIEDLRECILLVLEPELLIPLDVSAWSSIRKGL